MVIPRLFCSRGRFFCSGGRVYDNTGTSFGKATPRLWLPPHWLLHQVRFPRGIPTECATDFEDSVLERDALSKTLIRPRRVRNNEATTGLILVMGEITAQIHVDINWFVKQ